MKDFAEMTKELKLPDEINEFKKTVWPAFSDALAKRAVRTLTFWELYLGWLVLLKYKPKCILELGGQHGHSGLMFADAAKRLGSTFITVELGRSPLNDYDEGSCGTLEFLPDEPHIIKVWGEATTVLPEILKKHPVDFVFHDCAHTWDHVEKCVTLIKDKNPKIIQTCHDCADGIWNPTEKTRYGFICAEKPVFDKHFDNSEYYYNIFGDKYGFGIAIHKDIIL